MKLAPVKGKRSIRLEDEDARIRGGVPGGKALEKATEKEVERISDLQRVLTAVNPQGCSVWSFKAPTELELRHDYLWRVHQQMPPRGMIGIFNRSHYEDVLVPRVHGTIAKKEWLARYDQINDFERMLAANGVTILKFLLHISRDEQRERLEARLTDPSKNWKFRAGDLDDRARWDAFTKAYRGILEHTSTKWAPWYLVPADDKDVRDYLVARTIADRLKQLRLCYPPADPSIVGITID